MNIHPLKNYLIKNKISIKGFAKEIKISTRTIYYYFNNEKIPSPATAKKISSVTGIPVTELFYPEQPLEKENDHKRIRSSHGE